jgi:hypothetical protein
VGHLKFKSPSDSSFARCKPRNSQAIKPTFSGQCPNLDNPRRVGCFAPKTLSPVYLQLRSVASVIGKCTKQHSNIIIRLYMCTKRVVHGLVLRLSLIKSWRKLSMQYAFIQSTLKRRVCSTALEQIWKTRRECS